MLLGSFCSQANRSAHLQGLSTVGKAEAKEYEPNFFDSLNKGKEITLTAEDFQKENRAAGPSVNGSTVSGEFQVQFFAATQRNEAEKEKARIEEALSVPVSLVYEAPYFKLRAGRFATRQQAEEFKQRMLEAGHHEVWIVQKGR